MYGGKISPPTAWPKKNLQSVSKDKKLLQLDPTLMRKRSLKSQDSYQDQCVPRRQHPTVWAGRHSQLNIKSYFKVSNRHTPTFPSIALIFRSISQRSFARSCTQNSRDCNEGYQHPGIVHLASEAPIPWMCWCIFT